MKTIFDIRTPNKKGQQLVQAIWGLVGLAIGLVVLAIVNGLGADILDDIMDDQTANDYDYNATKAGLEGIDKVAGFTKTVATVGVTAMIIMIIIGAFGGLMVQGRRK